MVAVSAEITRSDNTKNTSHGFIPTFIDERDFPEPNWDKACHYSEYADYAAVNNNICIPPVTIPTYQERRQRKSISDSPVFNHSGVGYEVQVAEGSGCYDEIMQSIIDVFDKSVNHWRRVRCFRVDLHHKDKFTDDNKLISALFHDLNKLLSSEKNGDTFVRYVWVREMEKGKRQHYHLIVFIDGDKFLGTWTVYTKLKKVWEKVCRKHLQMKGTTWFPEHEENVSKLIDINSENFEEVKHAVIRVASYLAKERGKGYKLPQTNDFSGSRK